VSNPAATTLADVLQSVTAGRQPASELLPLVYQELRRVAQAHLACLPAGATLQATAVVHDAFIRLVGQRDPGWNGRGHFFSAAANAIRQILVDEARRKAALKRAGDRQRVALDAATLAVNAPCDDVLALNEFMSRLETADPLKGRIAMLRIYAGLSRDETAAALQMTARTVDREWRSIKTRLSHDLCHRDTVTDDDA
jgi:RNA polymerase sigma factor (TIGR02999 family)